jgi:hypothetical protein
MLVTNNRNAPSASAHSPPARLIPTTHSGGTSEIAMATPGSESATSSRLMQKAPPRPGERGVRAIRRGLVRAMI